jgi:hypothetical protein
LSSNRGLALPGGFPFISLRLRGFLLRYSHGRSTEIFTTFLA